MQAVNNREKIHVFLACIALFAVSFLIANNVLFIHFHNLESGITIIHAHPFSKESQDKPASEGHCHSENEFFLIGIINSLLLQLAIVFAIYLLVYRPLISKSSTYFNKFPIPHIFLDVHKARPPPIYNHC